MSSLFIKYLKLNSIHNKGQTFFLGLNSYADNELILYPLVEVVECCVTFETQIQCKRYHFQQGCMNNCYYSQTANQMMSLKSTNLELN